MADGERRRGAGRPTATRTPGIPLCLHLGGRRRASGEGACDCPSRGKGNVPPGEGGGVCSRLMAKRPSDRRSPGRNPGPQGAFEVSMINVSCNSH